MNQGTTIDVDAVMPLVRATGLLVSLCTITVPPASTTFDAGGAPDPAVPYVNLTGHVDIPCTAPPINTGDSITPTELKTMEEIMAQSLLHVLLNDYYPTIREDYRANIRAKGTAASTAVVYDIADVESDSQRKMTRLALKLATV